MYRVKDQATQKKGKRQVCGATLNLSEKCEVMMNICFIPYKLKQGNNDTFKSVL